MTEVPAPIGEESLDRLLAQVGAAHGRPLPDDIAVLLVSGMGDGADASLH